MPEVEPSAEDAYAFEKYWTGLHKLNDGNNDFAVRAVMAAAFYAGRASMGVSVLQPWVADLALREQAALMTAVRGCDVAPKFPLNSLERRVVSAIRWSFMVPADPREVGSEPGAFMSSDIPEPKGISSLGHYPMHWYSHIWHAVQILAYYHPDHGVAHIWALWYAAMCRDQHVPMESISAMQGRYREDRIAQGTVVS